jgi:SP family general alpha glucoside:H+ symporter-like MFS transporter
MTNDTTEKPSSASEVEAQPASTGGPVYDVNEKVDYNRTGAIDAEKAEHDMTVLQAARAYPAASWWAFVMSCTIVSSFPRLAERFSNTVIDHGVVLCFLDGTVRRHGAIRS